MPVSFTAIDFETANRSPASACAVGLVKVVDGAVVESDSWLIRPPAGHDSFTPFNVRLHGIAEADVSEAPTWTAQLPRLLEFADGDVLVAHNAPFDLGVMAAASLATDAALPVLRHFCSLRTARRVYDLASYRLPLAAAAAGFTDLVHHDPRSDAEAAAAIVIDAARRTGAADLDALANAVGVRIGELAIHSDRSGAERLVSGATFG
ncbi:DNA polymerase III subunit epsilon [Pseudoclavibacter chungangensis]|uniref:DNA polymerase III subunit epsilon n=1 Tax=Pseudoclavibacter chungangensis TaxID=587635 RepID=A0A7J5BWI1_9MICO|nr:exonuclease domain-containing protein [Pseudoclavibacter chungangensis]KAB1657911.1 DNA polymerase III subunit epsilon [Pseudoclavibacter chungangensis]NYJ65944.1 DNA polymerase-3 subunit epsilon [Pseudoclavibacter chungangensis]